MPASKAFCQEVVIHSISLSPSPPLSLSDNLIRARPQLETNVRNRYRTARIRTCTSVSVMCSLPWRSIEDDEGTATLVGVTDNDVKDWPKFMHHVLKEKIGMDKGVFKIRFAENFECSTSTSELITFVMNYFKTKGPQPCTSSGNPNPDVSSPHIESQRFFSGLQNDDLYGYCKDSLPHSVHARNTTLFLKRISNADPFVNQDTCCLRKLGVSHECLEEHYWNVIRQAAVAPSCGFSDFFVESMDTEDLLQKASALRSKYCFQPDFEEECHVQPSEESCQTDVKNVNKAPAAIVYAPGIPLKSKEFRISPGFSLSKLGTVLDLYPEEVGGVSYPYLYVGKAHASFPWHTEDAATFSINYLHCGAPCVWFFVSPENYKLFSECSHHFNLDPAHMSCKNVLGAAHKYVFASKNFLSKLGIPVHTVIQKEKEIVVTYPFAAHSGFKTGWNIQQAANFCDEWWVELALLAPTCDCFDDVFHIDLSMMLAVCRPHLLQMYRRRDFLSLFKELAKNKYIKSLGLLPPNTGLDQLPQSSFSDNVVASINEAEDNVKDEFSASDATDATAEEADAVYRFSGARCVLRCPAPSCHKVYEGGRSKMSRLMQHIHKDHGGDVELEGKAKLLYPAKQVKSKTRVCNICGELRAGGSYEMKLHLRRKHNV